MIYCNECKRMVPQWGQHTCDASLLDATRTCPDCGKIIRGYSTVHACMLGANPVPERNYIVICPSDQSNPPHVEFFEDYAAAETRAVARARESNRRYDVYRLAAAAYVVPQQPIVNIIGGPDNGA
jgi:hypothetical protein